MGTLNIENFVKKYGSTEVVHGINASINDGEFIALVGPSGCGKSTVLRMIAGLEDISSGELKINDKLMNDLPPKDRNIAMVFQNYALYPHMNVFENMSFSLRLKRSPKQEIQSKVNDAADILGLGSLLKRKPAELSGGQRQRVAMGRAIVRQPAVFLFDEPLSNLDAKLRIQMRLEIKKLHQRLKTTVLYVTHDQVEAMTLADRIIIMRDGIIEQIGRPLELYHEPVNTFVAGFIGTPPMNLLDAVVKNSDSGKVLHVNDVVQIPLGKLNLESGRQVVVGIRPEDIAVGENDLKPGYFRTQCTIDVSEPLGNEVIAHLDAGGAPVVASFKGTQDWNFGQRLSIDIDPASMHIFDKQTQKRVTA